MTHTFWIGVYPGLTNPMIDYMIESFEEFARMSIGSRDVASVEHAQ